jgi:hypothetical protein
VRLNATTLLASHDRFGAGLTDRAFVHVSHDDGDTWATLATVQGSYWSQLFVRDEPTVSRQLHPVVYLMGTSSSDVGAQVCLGRRPWVSWAL